MRKTGNLCTFPPEKSPTSQFWYSVQGQYFMPSFNLKYCLNFSRAVPLLSQGLFQNNLYAPSILTCTPLSSNFSLA